MAKTQQDVIIYNEKSFSTAQSQFEKDLKKLQLEGWRLVSVTPTKKRGFGHIVQLTAIYERDVVDYGGTSAATRAQERAQQAAIIAENKAEAQARELEIIAENMAKAKAERQEAQRIARERELAYQASLSPEQLQQYLKQKRRNTLIGLAIAATIVLGGLLLCIAVANNPATQASINADLTPVPTDTPAPPTPTPKPPTPTPTPKPKVWTTTHHFEGNGDKNTETITINGDNFKIKYNCKGFNDGTGIDGTMWVHLMDQNGNLIDDPINTTCKAGDAGTSGDSMEYQTGTFYLKIGATGDWSIDIQEMK